MQFLKSKYQTLEDENEKLKIELETKKFSTSPSDSDFKALRDEKNQLKERLK